MGQALGQPWWAFVFEGVRLLAIEIPKLRQEVARLSALIEELEENLIDESDEGLEIKPEVKAKLLRSLENASDTIISAEEFRKQLHRP